MENNAVTELINLEGFSFFKIMYKGMLPTYKDDDPHYKKSVKQYYFEATANSYDYKNSLIRFEKAVIHIRHHYKNRIIRDLDNRNRKYIIDAVRYSNIIFDDNWQHVSLHEEAIYNPVCNCVEVFIVPAEHYIQFLLFLKSIDDEQEELNHKPVFLDQEMEQQIYRIRRDNMRSQNLKQSKKAELLDKHFWS